MHSRWEEKRGRGGERLAKPGVILIYEANRYKNDKTNCE